jgi:hypothetical protein
MAAGTDRLGPLPSEAAGSRPDAHPQPRRGAARNTRGTQPAKHPTERPPRPRTHAPGTPPPRRSTAPRGPNLTMMRRPTR